MILLLNTGVDTLIEKASEHHVFFLAMVVMAIAGFTFMSALLWKLFASNAAKDKKIDELQTKVAKNQEEFRTEVLELYKEVNGMINENIQAITSIKSVNEANHKDMISRLTRLSTEIASTFDKRIKS